MLLTIFFFFHFHSHFLLNIKMETNYHSNLIFLYASKHNNLNHEIHFYLRGNRNRNKIFISIAHSHVPSMH